MWTTEFIKWNEMDRVKRNRVYLGAGILAILGWKYYARKKR